MLPELISTLYNNGCAACDNSYKSDPSVIFWSWLFVWSKIFEFGDTLFIILRKQKLTFLHWYHHAMTVICVFSYFPGMLPINRWTGSMNYLIHSIMYNYYSAKVFKIRMPRFISIIITALQIMQMLIGLGVAAYMLNAKLNGLPCKISIGEITFSLSVYLSYFVLFANFFIRSYFAPKQTEPAKKPNRPSY